MSAVRRSDCIVKLKPSVNLAQGGHEARRTYSTGMLCASLQAPRASVKRSETLGCMNCSHTTRECCERGGKPPCASNPERRRKLPTAVRSAAVVQQVVYLQRRVYRWFPASERSPQTERLICPRETSKMSAKKCGRGGGLLACRKEMIRPQRDLQPYMLV